MDVDEGNFYALLRFQEASDALRACFDLKLVDKLAGGSLDWQTLSDSFGFTAQASRTFGHLLVSMRVLEWQDPRDPSEGLKVTELAKKVLCCDSKLSRVPYLAMGENEVARELIDMLCGNFEGRALYDENSSECLMESESTQDVAREIAYGLASRARCFSRPLARLIRTSLESSPGVENGNQIVMADLGAGSPYVSLACIEEMGGQLAAMLVDQAAGLKFAREMYDELDSPKCKLDFVECNIFRSLPKADFYLLSNTVHDWLPNQCRELYRLIKSNASEGAAVMIHEPMQLSGNPTLENQWESLWKACYGLTLFKLTGGRGSCYTLEEHISMLAEEGFTQASDAVATSDGCDAVEFRLQEDVAKRKIKF